MSPARKKAEQPAEDVPEEVTNTAPVDEPETEEPSGETEEEPSGETATNSAPDSDPDETEPTPDAVKALDDIDDAAFVKVVYTGDADVFRYGEYAIRPGKVAHVPKSVAVELLTFPFERFEVKE